MLLNKVNHSGIIERSFVSSGRKFSLVKMKRLCLIRVLSHTDSGYPCLNDLHEFVIRGLSGSCETNCVNVLWVCCQLKMSKNALPCVF